MPHGRHQGGDVEPVSGHATPQAEVLVWGERDDAVPEFADAIGRTRASLPSMPSARVMRSAAISSVRPSPMLNQPRALARRSAAPSELGPEWRTFGSPLDRAMFEM